MDGIAAEVSQKLKSAIKAKLMELGAYVDDELSNYVMVMVTNRRSKAEMDRELQLFLAGNTSAFTNWLQSVWQKLEQVTIANPGIEAGKRKVPDKKKKTKKVTKSSPESSEDEKKRKKKRKSSASDTSVKDTKKKKTDGLADEKKAKKDDFRLQSETDSDNDQLIENFTSNMNKQFSKDTSVDSSIDEEEFLNIKEDFESEFLSDNEFSEGSSKGRSVTSQSKTSHKIDNDVTIKRSKDDSSISNAIGSKDDASKNNVVQTGSKISISELDHNAEVKGKAIIIRKPLVRDFKAGSPPKIKPRRHSPSPPARSQSRSRSTSQTKLVQLRHKNSKSPLHEDVKEDFNKKIQRSRLKSAAASGGSGGVKSRSGSRSRSRSPSLSRSPLRTAASKKMKIKDQSLAVLDARELINRKRAICMNSDSISSKDEEMSKRLLVSKVNVDANETDEQSSGKLKKLGTAKTTVSGGKMIRLRDRENYKQDCLLTGDDGKVIVDDDDDWVENDGNQLNENRKAATAALKLVRKFVVNKSDGKRSVVVQSSSSSKSPPPLTANRKKIDLREIRRTVYMEDGGDEEDNRDLVDDNQANATEIDTIEEEKSTKKMKLEDHTLQYGKPERVISSTVVKLPKPARPKPTAAQSASSTLIRKAMADAHKSLASSKEDSYKKRETLDGKSMVCRERNATAVTAQVQISDDEEMSLPKQSQSDDDDDDKRHSPKSTRSSDDRMDDKSEEDENLDKCDDQMNEAEEYDPSMNMPQFVVTLTGLDPKLYPTEDTDELMDTFNEDLTAAMDDGTKSKPKLQERCKYYPNCLVGDQCLYYHPTISCKLFPNCKFGSNCLYFHPKCKFDSMCTRYDCTFSHTTPRIAAPVTARHSPAPTIMNAQPCKFYYNCVNPVCPFQHPKICRFDRFCTNKHCTFSHTSLSHVSSVSKDKLKWSRPKDIDSSITSDIVEQKQQNDIALSNENY